MHSYTAKYHITFGNLLHVLIIVLTEAGHIGYCALTDRRWNENLLRKLS